MQHDPATALQPSALQGLGDRFEAAVLEAAARMEQVQAALLEQIRRADAMEQRTAALEEQLAVAEARLAVEQMHSAGLAAQASRLMAVAIEADVPTIAALTEKTNIDGASKTSLTRIYEEAFDAKAAELGIDDPGRFREG